MTGTGLIWFIVLYGLMGYGIGFDLALLAAFAVWGVWQVAKEIHKVRRLRNEQLADRS